MCRAIAISGEFDPNFCPLLHGLSAEEQEQRMRDDPRIAACISVADGVAAFARSDRRDRACEALRARQGLQTARQLRPSAS